MNTAYAAAVVAVVAFGAHAAADRRWQTGTWTQVGVKRTPFVGDVVQERMPSGLNKPRMTEVATYVIETDCSCSRTNGRKEREHRSSVFGLSSWLDWRLKTGDWSPV